jgi:two-component system, cell cycle response regulator DivK
MRTVLLVDDQWELRAIYGAYLEQHGYHVLTAADGNSALNAAREHHPDVILLDQSLPYRTGLEVTRELKSSGDTATIPIVMVTAHAYGAIGSRARSAGCDAFLAKPCQPSRILREVMRFVGVAA